MMRFLQDPVVSLAISLAIGLLFGLSAIHKLGSLAKFKAVLSSYQILPGPTAAITATAIPMVELSLAIGLVVPQARIAAALAASVLLTAYAMAMAVNIYRGNVLLDCGCNFGSARQTVSWGLVWRNLFLAIFPLLLLITPSDRIIGAADLAATVFAVIVASLFYATTNTLIQQQEFTRRLKP